MDKHQCSELRRALEGLLTACSQAKSDVTILFEGWKQAGLAPIDATKENFGTIVRLGDAINNAQHILAASHGDCPSAMRSGS